MSFLRAVARPMLATGHLPRVAAVVLAASLGPSTIAAHSFWREPDPQARSAQRVHFLKNVSMAGGLLMTAATGRERRARTSDAD